MTDDGLGSRWHVGAVPDEAPRRRRGGGAWAVLLGLSLAGVSTASADSPDAGDRLDLAALEQEALTRHPALATLRRQAQAAREVPSQAGSLPDPMLSFALSNMRLDEPGLDTSPMTGLVFGLSQGVPFPGKLDNRSDVAEARAVTARRRIELAEALVVFRVRQAYWRLHFAERARQIVRDSEHLIDTLTDIVHARVAVGHAAQQDALQAQVAHSRARSLVQEHEQQVVSRRRAVNRAVGREPTARLALTAPPEGPRDMPRADLVRAARDKSPAIVLSRTQVSTARAAVAEAKYDRWPDLLLGVGYRLRVAAPGDPSEGADMVFASLGITLPVWAGSKQNARVRERYHILEAASQSAHDVTLDVVTELEQAIDAVERLDRELVLYQKELLPEADQALDASITDYQNARVGFVSVLRNWQTQLDLEMTEVRLRTERAERLALIDSLTGPPRRKAAR